MLVSMMGTPMSIHYASNLQFMTDTFGTQASYPNGAREDGGAQYIISISGDWAWFSGWRATFTGRQIDQAQTAHRTLAG